MRVAVLSDIHGNGTALNYAIKDFQISFIKRLPYEFSFTLNKIKILCVHGTPKSIVEAIDHSASESEIRNAVNGVSEQVILCGHSHTSFIGEIDGKKIFNVGSVGNSLDGDNRISYGVLDFSKNNVTLLSRRIEYPINEIIDISIRNQFPLLNEYEQLILTASMD